MPLDLETNPRISLTSNEKPQMRRPKCLVQGGFIFASICFNTAAVTQRLGKVVRIELTISRLKVWRPTVRLALH